MKSACYENSLRNFHVNISNKFNALQINLPSRVAEQLAANGLRVLAIAMRPWSRLPNPLMPETMENQLYFLGFVGLMDPPRPEALEAVSLCRSAGITPVMVTGDHPATARAIARQLGIAAAGDRVMTGQELAWLSMEDLKREVKTVRVYARVA